MMPVEDAVKLVRQIYDRRSKRNGLPRGNERAEVDDELNDMRFRLKGAVDEEK